jgi:hypothetical protein
MSHLLECTELPRTTEEDIRLRSYLIWQQEGCPLGDELKHWQRAKAQMEAKSEVEYQAYLFR